MMPEVRKIGVVVNMSREAYELAVQQRKDWEFYFSHREEIKAQRAAFDTYWPNHESFDNPCVVRGEN